MLFHIQIALKHRMELLHNNTVKVIQKKTREIKM